MAELEPTSLEAIKSLEDFVQLMESLRPVVEGNYHDKFIKSPMTRNRTLTQIAMDDAAMLLTFLYQQGRGYYNRSGTIDLEARTYRQIMGYREDGLITDSFLDKQFLQHARRQLTDLTILTEPDFLRVLNPILPPAAIENAARSWNKLIACFGTMYGTREPIPDSLERLTAYLEREVELLWPKADRTAYPKIDDALKLLEKYSPMGKRIIEWASRQNINYQEKAFKNGNLGDYNPAKRIRTHANNDIRLNFTILAHELMHAVQDITWRRLQRPPAANYQALVSFNLCLEAAAQTAAVRMAYEAKLNGYPDAFDYALHNMGAYSPLFWEFDFRYNQAIATGRTPEQALQTACDFTHKTYMKSQPLRNIYNSNTLVFYIGSLLNSGKGAQFPTPDFNQKNAKGLTEFRPREFIVPNITMPATDEELFGDNKLMKQAFEFVEFRHLLEWSKGDRGNIGVQRKEKELIEDDDPYLRIADENFLKNAIAEYDRQMKENEVADIFDIMNEMAGLKTGRQLSLNFFAAATDDPAPAQNTIPATPVPAHPAIHP